MFGDVFAGSRDLDALTFFIFGNHGVADHITHFAIRFDDAIFDLIAFTAPQTFFMHLLNALSIVGMNIGKHLSNGRHRFIGVHHKEITQNLVGEVQLVGWVVIAPATHLSNSLRIV